MELDPQGGLLLVLVRGLGDACVLSAFGALLFRVRTAHAGAGAASIAVASLALAAGLTVAWAVLEAMALGGSVGVLGDVLGETLFGHVVLIRLALLLLAWIASAMRLIRPAAVAAGLAVVSLAGHGHALAMQAGASWLLGSEVVHLLAAGAWLGQLLPLAAFIAAASPADAALAARRFAPWGIVAVLAIAGTAAGQAFVLIGSWPGLTGSAYGRVALLKLVLFVLLLGLAARHRFRLTPALARSHGERSRIALWRSIGVEAAIGLGVVLAAGLLAELEPAMHLAMPAG